MQNGAKTVSLVAVLGLLGYAFSIYVLPVLVTIAWNMVSLAVATIIGVGLLGILTNKRFWRSLWYLNEAVAKIVFGLVIEFDEWVIQEQEIESVEREIVKFNEERDKLSGVAIKISNELVKMQDELEVATEKAKLASSDKDEESLEYYTTQMSLLKRNIEATAPLLADLKDVESFSDRLIKTIKSKLMLMKEDLKQSRRLYDTVKAGASALASAKRALMGDTQIANDADIAREAMKARIAHLGGQVRNSISTLKELQKDEVYGNRARVEMMRKTLAAENPEIVITTPAPAMPSYISSGTRPRPQTKFEGLI